ncbi:MAG TPA: aspartate aminotransferase family protein [Bryobacteraceae bacterium]|nr:aspartate aminotransferase family protein [Bryobacteraceae bacterium]
MSERWAKSREYLERAKLSLAGGVSSPFRAKAPVPLYFRNGCGSRLEDVDGNEYIDYVLAWGPMILGYRHPAIVEAMHRQAELPADYGAQHELEFVVSEQIQRMLPCAELVQFTSSGSEAVQIAFRLLRAFTGRTKILKFEGHYHGWLDGALISYKPSAAQAGPLEHPCAVTGSAGQVANSADNFVAAPWNRLDLLRRLIEAHRGEIAAVVMEPVLCNSGCILPQAGYLEKVQQLCREHGALLMFDEVITGFRMTTGGAQQFYGVQPDLATFGKAVAGGAPLSGIAGREEILMQMYSGVSFGGSFNGNPVSLASAQATLGELSRNNGAALAQANQLGAGLMAGIREIADRHSVPALVTGFGAALAIHFTNLRELTDYRDTLADDSKQLQRFLYLALEEGLHIVPDGRMYVSAVHTAQDIAETLTRLDAVFSKLS